MPAYTFVDYVYFKNMTDDQEINHRVCILNQIPDMYITPPFNFLAETFVSFPRLFVKQS